MKTCRKCSDKKPADQFNKHPATVDGLQSHCKSCQSAYASQRYNQRRIMELQMLESESTNDCDEKFCPVCLEVKPIALFYRKYTGRNGREVICSRCKIDAKSKGKKPVYKAIRTRAAFIDGNHNKQYYKIHHDTAGGGHCIKRVNLLRPLFGWDKDCLYQTLINGVGSKPSTVAFWRNDPKINDHGWIVGDLIGVKKVKSKQAYTTYGVFKWCAFDWSRHYNKI